MVERLLETGNKDQEAGNNQGSRIKDQEFLLRSASRTTEEQTGNSREGWTVGIAGARRGELIEAEELIKRLREKYPRIRFINLDNPNLKSISNDETLSGKKNSKLKVTTQFQISNFKFQIVLACHGMGKQEEWILENKDKIKAGIFMGVGGSLDFITGFTKRSPVIWRKLGLEWLWRGIQKPKHFKRIWQATVVFGFLVVNELTN
jgi:exopolysaccharide biosynthesis WecB/TagA/CpsF family protein